MRKPVGQGLPEPLARRLAAGRWLRTAHGGASYVAPDNSRAAIAAAVDLGVDMVEVDARLTADGQLALWHDDEVRAGGVALSIAASPLAALQRLDMGRGERIITLDDAMEVVRGRTALLIDLQADGLARPIVEAVKRVRAKKFVLDGEIVVPVGGELSFDDLLQRIHRRRERPGARTLPRLGGIEAAGTGR